MCKSWCEAILAIIILVFTFWKGLGDQVSMWIVVIAAVVLLIHSFTCKKCYGWHGKMNDGRAMKSSRKRR